MKQRYSICGWQLPRSSLADWSAARWGGRFFALPPALNKVIVFAHGFVPAYKLLFIVLADQQGHLTVFHHAHQVAVAVIGIDNFHWQRQGQWCAGGGINAEIFL